MIKSIIVSEDSWAKIHQNIAREYPSSVLLIREKMRKVLGFTVRRHQNFETDFNYDFGHWVSTIHLDFYDDKKRTMFLLKYSEYLEKPDLD